MKILHTADWHLGRIFYGVHLTEDQAYVLDQFVRLVGDTRPDVVLIAGDVYDRAVPPIEAVKLLDEVLSRILIDYKIPVVMVAGNHDSPERLGFAQRLLVSRGLYIVGEPSSEAEPVVVYDDWGPVYFCPIPYAEPPVVREKFGVDGLNSHEQAMITAVSRLASRLPRGVRKVAVTHAFVAGGEASESERPLAVGQAGTVSVNCFSIFNYTALGHLHRSQTVGRENMRYSGSLLKYSFSEASHRKSVTLVEMDGEGRIKVEEIFLTPRRDVRCVEGYLNEILAGPREGESREDYLMVTLKDTGAILDAMGKLREVYPNVLHIDRPYLTAGSQRIKPVRDYRKMTELELFASFFEQVTSNALTEEEAAVFAEVVESLWQRERESDR